MVHRKESDMADEPTDAGNDQQADEVKADQPTDEGQQPSQDEGLSKRLEELEAARAEDRAYITRLQQERATQPSTPTTNADEVVSYDAQGNPVTRQQIEQAKKMFGFDKTEKELAELKDSQKKREEREQYEKLESDFSSLEKEYGDKGIKVPKTDAEKQEFLNRAAREGIGNVRVAFEYLNRAQISSTAEKNAPKPAVPDKGENPSQDKDDTPYYKALDAARDGTGRVPPHKLADLRVKFGKASLKT